MIAITAAAQDKVFFGGLFPEMALSKSLPDNFQTTFKVESQHIRFDNRDPDKAPWEYAHYRTDLQGFIAKKLNPFWKVSAGYQYRLEGEGPNSHRTIQQVAYVLNSTGVRQGHRLRLDQTYTDGADTEYRMRYRFSLEVPLAGRTLDPGEFYFLTSNELIGGIQGGQGEIENRLVGSFGHYFGKELKLEAGLDWRIDKIIAEGLRNRLWLKVGCFLNF